MPHPHQNRKDRREYRSHSHHGILTIPAVTMHHTAKVSRPKPVAGYGMPGPMSWS